MNKLAKKTATLAVAATVLASLLTGCGSSKSSSSSSSSDVKVSGAAMKNYKAGEQFKATKKITIPILFNDNPAYPYKKDWEFWTDLTEKTNVTLKPTVVPMSDYSQKRSLLISSGNAPDIIAKTYPGEETPFVSSGAILPVSDYVKYMPNFEQKVKEWNLEPELDTLRQADGKYYVLPGIHQAYWPDYTLAVRVDIFKKNNIPLPKTWAELETDLEKLKKIYPNSIPFSDRFNTNTGNSTLNIAAPTFGTQAGWGLGDGLQFDKDSGKFVFAPATDNYKNLISYFHDLVAKGLMDKESFTQSDDQAVQKFETGKSFVIATNAQTTQQYITDMDKTLGKGKFEVAKITVPGGPKGDVVAGSRLENGIMITANAKKNPNFIAELQFIDWLLYSDAGEEFAKWGVEGKTFTKDANGKRTLEPDVTFGGAGLNPSGTKDLRTDLGFSQGNYAYGGSTELLQSMMSGPELQFQKDMESKTLLPPNPPHPYTQAQSEQQTLKQTPLTDYVQQSTLQFITGQRPLSDWDQYVNELKSKGMDQYVQTANDAYQAYLKTQKK
ncbi:extracellular solute-binding protein [Pullulanibacillus sp. KACC 23026]|uniref:ABC transporter substrate-binding protein n=1 Tax=Pullulanibacillus sp. KACC 23026 TaxID=3028315 RepID=UPI0023AF1BEE|nr:extracellular solute-binding protein [Pullulanibacillus sp. KACC 23026]WEG11876.1 extracellular solute-binding protein [Pullulanibacillus sp. KACC 23026]